MTFILNYTLLLILLVYNNTQRFKMNLKNNEQYEYKWKVG